MLNVYHVQGYPTQIAATVLTEAASAATAQTLGRGT
jgi:hypothetical protein